MSLKSLTSIHTVDYEVESVSDGASLGAVRSWSSSATSVACRVCPLSADRVVALAKDGMRLTHYIYHSSDPNVDERYRALFTDFGSVQHVLYVRAVINPDEVDRFWRVECEERRDVDNTSA